MLGNGEMPVPYKTDGSNDNGTYRGIGSSWFNADNIAQEDFYRNLQTIDYQNAFSAEQAKLDRDWQNEQNALNRAFQSEEAQKNRDWQEYMESTAVERMKKQGINPILAYSGAGGSAPSGGVASGSTSSGSRAYSSNHGYQANAHSDGLANLISSALQIGAGLLTKGASLKVSKAVGLAKASQPIQKIFIK